MKCELYLYLADLSITAENSQQACCSTDSKLWHIQVSAYLNVMIDTINKYEPWTLGYLNL